MKTKYDIGDTVLITATISKIQQMPNGEIRYHVKKDSIVAKVDHPCPLKQRSELPEGRHLKCGS